MKKIILIVAVLIILLAGCEFLDNLRNKIRGTVSTAVTEVTKIKESVEQKIEDVQNAAKEVSDAAKQLKEAADAVKKVGE